MTWPSLPSAPSPPASVSEAQYPPSTQGERLSSGRGFCWTPWTAVSPSCGAHRSSPALHPPPPSLPCGGSVVSASFCESSTRRTSPGAVRVQDALKKSRAGHGGREREAPAAQGRKGHPGEEGTTLAPSLHVHTQQTTCSPTGHRDGTPGPLQLHN